MKEGTRVEITGMCSYSGKYHGYRGTVVRTNNYGGNCFGVLLDNAFNTSSSKGYFWFRRPELTEVEKLKSLEIEISLSGSDYENYFKEMFPMNRFVGITFIHGSSLEFVAGCSEEFELGDLVVTSNKTDFALARVTSVDMSNVNPKLKNPDWEVVAKVNLAPFQKRAADRKRRAELKAAMDKQIQQFQRESMYAMMAEKDPQLAALFAEYKALDETNPPKLDEVKTELN